ncbi:MAG: GAF domain-containing protein [Acidobacterium ailaaui]|nr:GAF domain-containing protein [Pseudacidobacterium ailaaui]
MSETKSFSYSFQGNGDEQAAVNLTNCDREPIRIPGSIQAHGFLLGLDHRGDRPRVLLASENVPEYLGIPLDRVLGRELHEFLPSEIAASFAEAETVSDAGIESPRFCGTVELSSQQFHGVSHWTGGLRILEFEKVTPAADGRDLNTIIADFVTGLERCREEEELWQTITRQVRQLTGFDRVLFYCFDENGHGNVLAEERNDRLPSYLGLRFPASDIPRQARELYVLNRVRIIPDVEYRPSPLVSADPSFDPSRLDLSFSMLRSVSPIHREYMRNMRTHSSMSVSIVMDGRLWGLISAHHREAKMVPYLVRSACDILGRILATQLAAFHKAREMEHAIQLQSVHRRLLTYMAAGENYIDGLANHADELCALTGARGAAIIVGERCVCLRQTPPQKDVLALSNWLTDRLQNSIFVTHELGSLFPVSEGLRTHASGVLALSLSKIHRMHVLWFRPEMVQTVHWAGEPAKAQEVVDGVLQIHPRQSFASWKETVRGKSEPWKAVEVESARDFRNAVLEIVLKKAEELADMAFELEVANKELEAFSYSVSHDLRAPFRHISGFAELLLANENERLSERGRRHLATIAESAQYAGMLVDSLLNFSRLSRSPLEMKPVDMRLLVEDVWRDILKQEALEQKVLFEAAAMPVVQTDLNLMRQVWWNLLSNAVKYSRKKDPAIIRVGFERKNEELVFSVHDNGIGFENEYAHKLFGVFQRLHRQEEFEGIGIGLANVRRIITRMGGRTWAEGRPQQGASFSFSLPASAEVTGNGAKTKNKSTKHESI